LRISVLVVRNSKFKIQNADLEWSDSARVMPCATTHLESSARKRVKTVVSSKPEQLILNFELLLGRLRQSINRGG
jgi:hypothetical protein